MPCCTLQSSCAKGYIAATLAGMFARWFGWSETDTLFRSLECSLPETLNPSWSRSKKNRVPPTSPKSVKRACLFNQSAQPPKPSPKTEGGAVPHLVDPPSFPPLPRPSLRSRRRSADRRSPRRPAAWRLRRIGGSKAPARRSALGPGRRGEEMRRDGLVGKEMEEMLWELEESQKRAAS